MNGGNDTDGKGRERMKLPRMRVRANRVDSRKKDGGGNGWPYRKVDIVGITVTMRTGSPSSFPMAILSP